jgi:hypothetical protein
MKGKNTKNSASPPKSADAWILSNIPYVVNDMGRLI